jgi:peptidoglycan/LPS O-acetylase OafA/YrhL
VARERFDTLDGMRGVAAILVMLHHYYTNAHLPFLQNTFIAVDFFFILSGFVIMHAYGARLAGGMAPRHYFGRRLARLYPMMAIGLLGGAAVLIFYAHMGHADYTSREIVSSTITNLFFLPYLNSQAIFDGATKLPGMLFPGDGPLWSVFFELLASGCFIWLCRLSSAGLQRFCLLCLVGTMGYAALLGFVHYSGELWVGSGWGAENFLGGLPRVFYGFSCGMLLYRARHRLGQRYFAAPSFSSSPGALVLYLLLAAVLLCPFPLHGCYYFVAIALLAPGLVMWGGEVDPANNLLAGISRWLGWLSYPVYCLHLPVLFAWYILEEKYGLAQRTGVALPLLAIASTLLLAALIGRFIDAPAREWLKNKLERSRQRLPAYSQQVSFGSRLGFAEDDQARFNTGEPQP